MRFCRQVATVAAAAAAMLGSGCGESKMAAQAKAAHVERYDRIKSNIYLQAAERDFAAGDLNAAESTLRTVIAADTENPRVFLLSGRIAIERGQLERAVILLNQTLQLDASLPEPHYYLGVIHQRWRNDETSLKHYRAAYDLEPDNVTYLMPIGEVLVTMGRTDEALTLFKSKERYFDSSAGLRMAIGQILYVQGKYSQAVEYLHKASVMSPDDLHVREELALAQLASGDARGTVRPQRPSAHR